jgi:hydroxymethylbilane synthase
VPIAAHGTVNGDTLTLVGFIASVDGKQTVRDSISGSTADAGKLGIELADKLLAAGGKAILEDVYQREIAH